MTLQEEIENELLKPGYGINGVIIPSLKVNLTEIAKNFAKAKLEEAAEKLNPLFDILPNINNTPPIRRMDGNCYSQHWRGIKRSITETTLE